MDYTLNRGAGAGVRLGLIVLQTDETLEFEARQGSGRARCRALRRGAGA